MGATHRGGKCGPSLLTQPLEFFCARLDAVRREAQSKAPGAHARSTTKLDAFRAVRKALRNQHPEPFFWAPFIYIGDPG